MHGFFTNWRIISHKISRYAARDRDDRIERENLLDRAAAAPSDPEQFSLVRGAREDGAGQYELCSRGSGDGDAEQMRVFHKRSR